MKRPLHLRNTALIAFSIVAVSAQAENYRWLGTGNSGWNDRLNWQRGTAQFGVPVSSDATALFFTEQGSRLDSNNDIAGTLRLGSLNFGNRDGWVLSGNALEFNAGTVNANGSATVLNGISILTGLTTNVASNKTLTLVGNVNGAGSLTKGGAGTLLLSGSVQNGGLRIEAGTVQTTANAVFGGSGAIPVTMTGGTLSLGGNAFVSNLTMASGTTVSGAGTLNLAGDIAFGGSYTGVNIVPGGTIGTGVVLSTGDHAFKGTGTVSGVVSGAGSLLFDTDQGQETTLVTLAATNTYTGGTFIRNALVVLHANEALSQGTALNLQNGSLYVGESGLAPFTQTVSRLDGTGSLIIGGGSDSRRTEHNTLILDLARGRSDFDGSIQGFGDLVKRGGGQFVWENTQGEGLSIGRLNLEGGTMAVSGVAINVLEMNLAAGTTFTHSANSLSVFRKFSGAGTIQLNNSLNIFNSSSDFSGTLQGAGGLLLAYSPTVDWSRANLSAFSGAISVDGSSLILGNAPSFGAGVTLTNGATLDVRENGTGVAGFLGTLNGASGTTFAKSGTGELRVRSAGFGGRTRVDAGTLTVTRDALYRSTDGIAVAQGATLGFGGGSASVSTSTLDNAGTLVGSGRVTAGSVTNAATGTIRTNPAERLAFSGGVTNRGTLNLVGDGEIDVAGTLTNAAGSLVTGRGTLRSGGLTQSGTMAFSGGSSDVYGKVGILAGGAVQNSGGGALTFWDDVVHNGTEIRTNAGSYTTFKGSVSGAGAYTGLGTVEFDGDLRPGNSPASVSFAGNLVLTDSNDLTMELGGTTLGTGYDHLTVRGTAFLDGKLNVVSFNGFNATMGQSFDLFDFAARQGMFASISLPTLANGLVWNTNSLYTNGTVSVQAVPEPASLAILGVGAVGLLRRRKRA